LLIVVAKVFIDVRSLRTANCDPGHSVDGSQSVSSAEFCSWQHIRVGGHLGGSRDDGAVEAFGIGAIGTVATTSSSLK